MLHFIKTNLYMRVVPPWIPHPEAMVLVSGAFEILGGLGLLMPQMRWAASRGLIALLVAVFPANIYMATDPAGAGILTVPPVLLWARLPLQLLLVWWLVWCTRPASNRWRPEFQ